MHLFRKYVQLYMDWNETFAFSKLKTQFKYYGWIIFIMKRSVIYDIVVLIFRKKCCASNISNCIFLRKFDLFRLRVCYFLMPWPHQKKIPYSIKFEIQPKIIILVHIRLCPFFAVSINKCLTIAKRPTDWCLFCYSF